MLLYTSILLAQSPGFRAGYSLSNIYARSYHLQSGDAGHGFTVGVFYDIPLDQTFSLRPELNYSQKGGEYYSNFLSVEMDLSYIDLPVGLHISNFKPFCFSFGTQLSILVDVETRYYSFYNYQHKRNFQFEKDNDPADYHRINVGGFTAIGFQLDKVIIEIRVAFDWLPIDRSRILDGLEIEEHGLKTFSLQATAGYMFD